MPKSQHPFFVSSAKEPTFTSSISHALLKKPLYRNNEWTFDIPSENIRNERKSTWSPRGTITENDLGEKLNDKVCVCLSRLAMVYSFCRSKAVDECHNLFLFFRRPQWKRLWLLANKRSYQANRQTVIGLVGRVFANGPGDLGLLPDRVIPKTLKMVLDTSWLNT